MLDKLLKMLDSFKENQISAILHTNRERMVAMLNGPYFSDKIKPYFATMHAEGVPFTDFDDQPKQIIQIKEIINALYHAEQAFLDLETVNLRNGTNKIKDVQQLYSHTIDHGYKASYLLTHLDIELSDLFANEIRMILPALIAFQDYADKHTKDAVEFTRKLQQYPISYKAGLVSGIAVDQMKPGSGEIDYSFLTQLGSVLPGYLQQFTAYVHQYSPQQLANINPPLDQTQLDALQREGFYLLNNLQNLQDQDVFISARLLNYANAIRRVISLSMTTLEQMQNLNDSSQDVIRNNLAKLKYECLVPLFALADRIEDETLLTPGTLSTPLMAQVKPLYDFLIEYTSKVVDFSAKGRELLTIEDDRFVHLRLAETERRVNDAKRNIVKIEQAQADLDCFFDLLQISEKANPYFIDLPEETKNTLATTYKTLEPYVRKIDSELNNKIIKALTLKAGWNYRAWNPLCPAHEKITAQNVLDLTTQLRSTLARDNNTQTFHIILNEDLISAVHQRADLRLFPYDEKSKVFDCNEEAALKIEPDSPNDFNFNVQGANRYVTNTASLTTEQAFELYQFYTDKLARLERARTAYHQFMELIKTPHSKLFKNIDNETKARLRRLYCLFQPYMIDSKIFGKDYDVIIVANLADTTDKPESQQPKPLSTAFFKIDERPQTFLTSLNTLAGSFQDRAHYFREQVGEKYKATAHARELKPDETNDSRAHYLLKDTKYSKAIAEFRASVFQLRALFNDTTQKQLNPALYITGTGLPFPELESGVSLLKESRQILGIKYILNSLYHIEETSRHLEALNDQSTQTVYVYHLIQIYNHLDSIVHSARELQKDPYLALLTSDISNRASEIYQMLLTRSEPYRTSPDMVGAIEATAPDTDGIAPAATPGADGTLPAVRAIQQVEYGGIWYPLNALTLVPAYIKSLSSENGLPAEEKEAIQEHTKQIVLGIEGIIRNSNSYFQLFLKTRVMLQLFLELREKLSEFTNLTHGAVLQHLEELNTEHFAKMLLEADEWEDRMGLQPGLLSGPMKLMLDEFYKGLVEPLGFVSQKHIALVTTLEPIEKRLDRVRIRKEQATQEKHKFTEAYTTMARLLKLFATYDNFTSGPPPHPLAMQSLEQDLTEAYNMALPILQRHQDLFDLLKKEDRIEKSPKIDRFLATRKQPLSPIDRYVGGAQAHSPFSPLFESSLQLELPQTKSKQAVIDIRMEETEMRFKEAQPVEEITAYAESSIAIPTQPSIAPSFELREHIKAHCQVVFNYYQGNINTHDTEITTAKEKERYLEDLHRKQKIQNDKFVVDYTKKVIKKQIEAATSRYIGLLHVQKEYNNKLERYLESQEEIIIEAAKRSDDIDSLVQEMIAQRVLRFDKKHYRDYTHLESVMVSLNEFKTYFTDVSTNLLNNNSYFETAETLENKSRLVMRLETVAMNGEQPVKSRFQEMRTITNELQFQSTMLKHSKPETFTFAWLVQKLAAFLTLLHIYKPTYIRRYEELNDAFINPPSEQAINRWRLFEPPKAKRRYALPPQTLAVARAAHPDDEERLAAQEPAPFVV